MIKTKRTFAGMLLAAVTCVALAFGIAFTDNGVTAKADEEPTITGADFYVAMAVRLKDGTYPNGGVRFRTRVEKTKFNALLDGENFIDGVKTGILVTSKAIADELELEGGLGLVLANNKVDGVYDLDTTNYWYAATENATDYYESVGVIYNVPFEKTTVKLAVRPYVTIGETTVYRDEVGVASMADVVKELNNRDGFESYLPSYTITWKNDDGTALKTEKVEYDSIPAYGEDPTKAATAQYTYTFSGWTPEIVAATEDATYTATYDSVVNTYTVTVASGNPAYGTVDVSSIENVPYGTEITASDNTVNINGTNVTATAKTSTDEDIYSFTGWTNGSTTVSGNLEITANFALEYQLPEGVTKYHYSKIINVSGADIAADNENGYMVYKTTTAGQSERRVRIQDVESLVGGTYIVFKIKYVGDATISAIGLGTGSPSDHYGYLFLEWFNADKSCMLEQVSSEQNDKWLYLGFRVFNDVTIDNSYKGTFGFCTDTTAGKEIFIENAYVMTAAAYDDFFTWPDVNGISGEGVTKYATSALKNAPDYNATYKTTANFLDKNISNEMLIWGKNNLAANNHYGLCRRVVIDGVTNYTAGQYVAFMVRKYMDGKFVSLFYTTGGATTVDPVGYYDIEMNQIDALATGQWGYIVYRVPANITVNTTNNAGSGAGSFAIMGNTHDAGNQAGWCLYLYVRQAYIMTSNVFNNNFIDNSAASVSGISGEGITEYGYNKVVAAPHYGKVGATDYKTLDFIGYNEKGGYAVIDNSVSDAALSRRAVLEGVDSYAEGQYIAFLIKNVNGGTIDGFFWDGIGSGGHTSANVGLYNLEGTKVDSLAAGEWGYIVFHADGNVTVNKADNAQNAGGSFSLVGNKTANSALTLEVKSAYVLTSEAFTNSFNA